MRQEKSAGAVIYCMSNEPLFLFLKNTLKTTYWEFPKGKIEINEPVESTVKREIKEETNLDKIEIVPGFKHTLQWFFKFQGDLVKKEAVYLLAKIKLAEKEKVKISKEHQDFKWLTLEQAMQVTKIKANKEMLLKAFDFIEEHEKQKTLA
jgi:8-oxo-dGTP pyrophosphatase MutT (NUDIX family)